MTTHIMRPRHRHSINDVRAYYPLRFLHLHTYRGGVKTELMIIDGGGDFDPVSLQLDRAGRDRLIRELQAANYYEDQVLAHPDARELT